METFEQAIKWAKYFGGSELSFTGMGEAMLNPEFEAMMYIARSELPDTWFLLSTNGILLADKKNPARTEILLSVLKDARCTVYVSTHRPEVAGEAIENCGKAGIPVGTNTAFVTSGFDWAGQVKWHGIPAPRTECQYLKQGWGTVLQDGRIVNCCFDAHGLHPVGTVWDEVDELQMHPMPLCEKCHLSIPK